MISLDVKTEASSSSPLNLGTSAKEEEPKLSFSELLKGVKNANSDSKDDTKEIVKTNENKVLKDENLILSLDNQEAKTDAKTDSLLSLLKNSDSQANKTLGINPKLSENLTQKELKTLISDSKNYLKTQILQTDGYKQAQIKELPKTLDGLSDVAKTLGIDISKITLQEVSSKTQTALQETNNKSLNINKELKVIYPKQKSEITQDVSKKEILDKNTTLKEALNAVEKKTQNIDAKVDSKDTQITDTKQIQTDKTSKDLGKTSVFKMVSQTEHTTQQLVQTKQLKSDEKSQKDKTNEALKTLLSGDKSAQTTSHILSAINTEVSKTNISSSEPISTLEQLLSNSKGEEKDSLNSLLSSNSKAESLNVHKADSFEVKLNEAKQMIKYLSDDIKNAMNDYKSPFTRIKVQLNPKNLGDVDLTVVQRGNNLHVNLSSNNVAINTLAMNINELKTQLQNSGINNATFNFNSQDNNGQNAGQQQQNRQNEQNAQDQYSYFENEEQNEEILRSLEIIVPRYI